MHYRIERNYGCRISDSWTYRGLRTAVLENELLRVVVLIDKGADVYEFLHKPTDTDFVWRSPWGVRDPSKFVPTTGSHAELWLDQYEGGWQTVLPGGGFPSEYGDAAPGPARRGQHRAVGRLHRRGLPRPRRAEVLGQDGPHPLLLREDHDPGVRARPSSRPTSCS